MVDQPVRFNLDSFALVVFLIAKADPAVLAYSLLQGFEFVLAVGQRLIMVTM
ncbi:MAG: hypothetical protein RQ715_05445 [Methylococcales bacterium]|nr:hypothetical protein [Methylococcales bacterium]